MQHGPLPPCPLPASGWVELRGMPYHQAVVACAHAPSGGSGCDAGLVGCGILTRTAARAPWCRATPKPDCLDQPMCMCGCGYGTAVVRVEERVRGRGKGAADGATQQGQHRTVPRAVRAPPLSPSTPKAVNVQGRARLWIACRLPVRLGGACTPGVVAIVGHSA